MLQMEKEELEEKKLEQAMKRRRRGEEVLKNLIYSTSTDVFTVRVKELNEGNCCVKIINSLLKLKSLLSPQNELFSTFCGSNLFI